MLEYKQVKIGVQVMVDASVSHVVHSNSNSLLSWSIIKVTTIINLFHVNESN